jgi:aromatic ring-opening dioxygenase catalytic subunit (LigB family)
MEPQPGWPRDTWDRMAAFLRGLDAHLGRRPRAVLVISGHWETERPTLNVAEAPPLLFDYHGFPEHTYRLTYPVPGAPEMASEARELLAAAGFASDVEGQRGLDHGVFIPFKLIYPDADVPMVQLSLQQGLDAATHLAIGRALAPLRSEDVLIVGSGMSYHNLRAMFSGQGNEAAAAFDAALTDALADPRTREQALVNWRALPGALEAQPRPDHLLPLMVAAGAAGGEPGRSIFADRVLGKAVSGFQFG